MNGRIKSAQFNSAIVQCEEALRICVDDVGHVKVIWLESLSSATIVVVCFLVPGFNFIAHNDTVHSHPIYYRLWWY